MFANSNPAIPRPWFERYDALAADIRTRAGGRKILLVTHKGNWGDALILAGVRTFLEYYRFDWIEISGRNALRRSNIEKTCLAYPLNNYFPVFTASGSLEPYYGMIEKLRNATRAFEGGLILPATCGQAISGFGFHPNTRLWIRDQSFSRRNHPAGPFCHDMAFFQKKYRFPKLRDHAVFLRRDAESPANQHYGGIDLSALGSERTPIWPFLAIIGSHRSITTNRLHVAVGAALCGVPCRLLPAATPKIGAIWESSLSKFSNSVELIREGTGGLR